MVSANPARPWDWAAAISGCGGADSSPISAASQTCRAGRRTFHDSPSRAGPLSSSASLTARSHCAVRTGSKSATVRTTCACSLGRWHRDESVATQRRRSVIMRRTSHPPLRADNRWTNGASNVGGNFCGELQAVRRYSDRRLAALERGSRQAAVWLGRIVRASGTRRARLTLGRALQNGNGFRGSRYACVAGSAAWRSLPQAERQ